PRYWRIRLECVVADEAFFGLSLNDGGRIVFLRKLVEDRTRFGIDYRNFNELSVIDPPDVDVVVEVNRPRALRRALRQLKTGFRKHQSLRRNGNLELPQQGREVSVLFVVL